MSSVNRQQYVNAICLYYTSKIGQNREKLINNLGDKNTKIFLKVLQSQPVSDADLKTLSTQLKAMDNPKYKFKSVHFKSKEAKALLKEIKKFPIAHRLPLHKENIETIISINTALLKQEKALLKQEKAERINLLPLKKLRMDDLPYRTHIDTTDRSLRSINWKDIFPKAGNLIELTIQPLHLKEIMNKQKIEILTLKYGLITPNIINQLKSLSNLKFLAIESCCGRQEILEDLKNLNPTPLVVNFQSFSD